MREAEEGQIPNGDSSSPSDNGSTIKTQLSQNEKTDVEPQPPPQQSTTDEQPPPNGGARAWLIVLGAFFLFFNSWGTVNTFGEFQTYYQTDLLRHESPSNISWIGSIQAFLLLFVGVITGPLYDMGYFRLLIGIGAVFVPFGFFMTSICKEYWQFVLAQGIVTGIGNGALLIPTFAILPQYFTTRKALANGLATSGSGLGGIIYPIIFHRLIGPIGFGWTTRVIGFIALATGLFSVIIMKPRVLPKQRRALLEPGAFRELPYTLFCISMFLCFLGFYTFVFYCQPYAIRQGMNPNLAFYLVPLFNASAIFGRIIPNYIADKTGPLNVLVPASLATGTLALAWIGVHSNAGIIVLTLLYGFTSGGFVSLPPVALVYLTKDMRRLGTRMGMGFTICSLGLLIGAPSSGAILNNTGEYLGLQLYSGLALMLSGGFMIWTRIAKGGAGLRVKA
ncbi:MAG: hypothetical protein Q9227_005801 [Pyrenula ochraceoflavens]